MISAKVFNRQIPYSVCGYIFLKKEIFKLVD